ncbi:hypothetical protein LY622_17580 [Halomonas sp. M5N1S17]|uniref:hypothetical protein n=1 Tax=Halomonas alkalisoli TaxID=2907158 RepID=UPI001F3B4AD5|nr:hypothetical protein [Halomonas alkalisoli]MCE9665242.1 hypothetical protein [Halomonas alkalisoli]
MMSKEFLKHLGILGITVGLTASPLVMAQQTQQDPAGQQESGQVFDSEPGAPEAPHSDPTMDPTDQADPAYPDDAAAPADPTAPVDPAEEGAQTDPTRDPTAPADPAFPDDSAAPADPTAPADPAEQGTQTDPTMDPTAPGTETAPGAEGDAGFGEGTEPMPGADPAQDEWEQEYYEDD